MHLLTGWGKPSPRTELNQIHLVFSALPDAEAEPACVVGVFIAVFIAVLMAPLCEAGAALRSSKHHNPRRGQPGPAFGSCNIGSHERGPVFRHSRLRSRRMGNRARKPRTQSSDLSTPPQRVGPRLRGCRSEFGVSGPRLHQNTRWTHANQPACPPGAAHRLPDSRPGDLHQCFCRRPGRLAARRQHVGRRRRR